MKIKRNIGILYSMSFLQGMVFYSSVSTLYRQAAGITPVSYTHLDVYKRQGRRNLVFVSGTKRYDAGRGTVMTEKKELSFTEGSVFSSLVRFAIPVLGALILQAAYGAVDLLVVGQFGDAASISAVGTGSSFMNMVTFIITSLAMGSTAVSYTHLDVYKRQR